MTTSQQPPGPAVDLQGRAVIDPSLNVKESQRLAVQRLDDLRKMDSGQIRREMKLHSEHSKELRHIEAAHSKELRVAEAARLDAIRTTSDAAVQSAALVQANAASALATQLQATAEAMRVQVASTATAAATAVVTASTAQAASQGQALAPIQDALASLQKFQYEFAGGKAQVVETRDASADLRPILDAITELQSNRSERRGQEKQTNNARLWLGLGIAALGLVSAFLFSAAGIAITLLWRMK